MTDYHYTAELAYDRSRLAGDPAWLELSIEERDGLAEFARAIEHEYQTPPDTWCPDCDDLKDEIRALEDEVSDLADELEDLRAENQELREKAA